jgi:enoyl-CoA hydratase
MLSCEQDVLRKYKKLIDDGYGESFRQGLALESEANLTHAKTLTPEGLEARRHNVQSRGRQQSK